MALVRFTQTTSSKLGTIAKKTGTVYFLTDTNQIYGDFEINGTVTRAKYTADGFVKKTGDTMSGDLLSTGQIISGIRAIPASSDLNDPSYARPGRYQCQSSASAASLTNSPTSSAFEMEVKTLVNRDPSTYTGDVYGWRTIISSQTQIWMQQISRVGGIWTFRDWSKVARTFLKDCWFDTSENYPYRSYVMTQEGKTLGLLLGKRGVIAYDVDNNQALSYAIDNLSIIASNDEQITLTTSPTAIPKLYTISRQGNERGFTPGNGYVTCNQSGTVRLTAGVFIGGGVSPGDRVQVYWRRYRPSDQSEENSFVYARTVQGSGDSVQTIETAISVEPGDRFSMYVANITANRGTVPRGACKLNMKYTYIGE